MTRARHSPSSVTTNGRTLEGVLLSVNVGSVGVLRSGGREIVTAYNKSPVDGPVQLTTLGLPGDEHVYRTHGGPDKAVSVYAHEHYAYWSSRLGITLPSTAAFGENFTVSGLLERDVWLGDVFEVGEAVVQVTEPRKPCYKIAARYGIKEMALYVQQESLTGFLLRVLREGRVGAGQTLRLVDRQPHGVTVAEANRAGNAHGRGVDRRASTPLRRQHGTRSRKGDTS